MIQFFTPVKSRWTILLMSKLCNFIFRIVLLEHIVRLGLLVLGIPGVARQHLSTDLQSDFCINQTSIISPLCVGSLVNLVDIVSKHYINEKVDISFRLASELQNGN